jgi:UDP-glucose 4-epimerase
MSSPLGARLDGKRVLLTGATGFIGAHLVRRILAEPVRGLVAFARTPPAARDPRLKHVRGDLQTVDARLWKDNAVDRVDVVFHLGAFVPKTAAENADIDGITRVNITGARMLLDSLPSTPDAVVFASTLDVYSRPNDGVLLNESSPIGPISLYGAAKYFGESLLKELAAQRGFGLRILRYGHIYGPGEGAYRKFIPNAIRSMLAGRSPMVAGDGSALRDYLHVTDAAEATARSAPVIPSEVEGPTQAIGPQVLNIVSGTSRSLTEVVKVLQQLMDVAVPIEYAPSSSPQHSLRFDDTAMREALGSWQRVPFEKGLADEVAYFKQEVT